MRNAIPQVCSIPILDFPDVPENTNPNGKQYLVISCIGRQLRLPRSVLDFSFGHVIMPVWLAEKILKPEEWKS